MNRRIAASLRRRARRPEPSGRFRRGPGDTSRMQLYAAAHGWSDCEGGPAPGRRHRRGRATQGASEMNLRTWIFAAAAVVGAAATSLLKPQAVWAAAKP